METTNHNVLAFKTSLDKGHNPRDYSYQKEDIPTLVPHPSVKKWH